MYIIKQTVLALGRVDSNEKHRPKDYSPGRVFSRGTFADRKPFPRYNQLNRHLGECE